MPLAASAGFGPGPALPLPPGVPPRYILHVGDLHARRNVGILVKALTNVRATTAASEAGLVLAGVAREAPDAAAVAAPFVTFTGHTSEASLLALYRSAAALVYPSRYEGFGLPLVEAMACGVPVIASRASCIPEVTGGAAILVDPDDEQGWTTAIGARARRCGHRRGDEPGGPAPRRRLLVAPHGGGHGGDIRPAPPSRMTTPDVSVIVLNYNGRRWLGPCLDALAAQRDPPPFETIVVDNASTDESVALLGAQFPWVRVVRNDRNLGFAAGNNVGSASASGATLVFLNNDTVVEPEWLANLCRPLTAGGVDLVTSRVVFLDDPAVVDSAGDGYLRAGGAYKRGHRSPVAPHLESKEVFGACGAAFAIRRSLFVELGGFDARFFMVYEDVDLWYRARLAGHRCWYAADAVVRHAGSGTLGRLSDSAVFYGQRNLEWTWIKNTPRPLLLRTAFSHALYSASGSRVLRPRRPLRLRTARQSRSAGGHRRDPA